MLPCSSAGASSTNSDDSQNVYLGTLLPTGSNRLWPSAADTGVLGADTGWPLAPSEVPTYRSHATISDVLKITRRRSHAALATRGIHTAVSEGVNRLCDWHQTAAMSGYFCQLCQTAAEFRTVVY